jgi:proline iminopeptidase
MSTQTQSQPIPAIDAESAATGTPWRSRLTDRRIIMAGAAALSLLSGVLAAGVMPRGPVTRPQALWLMAGVLLVGAAAGVVMRSRWAVLVAPVGHLAGFELARATVFDVEGVLFGPVHLDTTAGSTLFVVSHLFYALVTVPPMALGAIVGAAWARRAQPRPERPRRGRWQRVAGRIGLGTRVLLTVVLAVGVGLLAYQLGRPGQVAPVRGPGGEPVAGSIATLEQVRLGGVDQWVSIRGRSVDNPVLLYLSGGPGGSDLALVRWNQRLEDRFTVVVWEQRGTGMSYPSIDPSDALTLDRMVADGIELTRWLQGRFEEQKVYLVGNSWGTILGVLMAQRSPELFWAYIGTGQMVSPRETDRILYAQALGYADRTGDQALADRLREWGPPPYPDPTTDALAHATIGLLYEDLEPYDLAATEIRPNTMTDRFFHGEYGLLDSWNSLRGLADMFSILYPELRDIDFRVSATRLELPVYLLEGRHELTSRRGPALEWYHLLQAPSKQLVWFERSGHNPQFEEATRYTDLMTGPILTATYGS